MSNIDQAIKNVELMDSHFESEPFIIEYNLEQGISKKDVIKFLKDLKKNGNNGNGNGNNGLVENKIDVELAYLKDNNFTSRKIASRYLKNKKTKNGFSTSEIYIYLSGEGNPKESLMAEFIYNKINE